MTTMLKNLHLFFSLLILWHQNKILWGVSLFFCVSLTEMAHTINPGREAVQLHTELLKAHINNEIMADQKVIFLSQGYNTDYLQGCS